MDIGNSNKFYGGLCQWEMLLEIGEVVNE
jgi:hypothetical protein